MKRLLFTLIFCVLTIQAVRAEKVLIYHSPESANDVRYQFHWEVLRKILEKTKAKYGGLSLKPSTFMTENRQILEFEKNNISLLGVLIRETSTAYEKKFIPVRIPIDRNLVGYRVFLKNKMSSLASIKTVDQLKKYILVQGEGWGDVQILQNAGLKVQTKVHYDDLFKIIDANKADLFPRGINEVQEEYRKFSKQFPAINIDEHLLIYYPLPTYFWFHNTQEGKVLAKRVTEGFEEIIKDGTYSAIFDRYFKETLRNLDLKNRVLIKLDNPYLPTTVPFNKKEYWLNPDLF